LNLRERVDARLKRHKEAHSADLLKLHFERGRRRDLEKKELRRRQADNEREKQNNYGFLTSLKGKATAGQAV